MAVWRRCGRPFGSQHLGNHAAFADRRAAPLAMPLQGFVAGPGFADEGGAGSWRGSAVKRPGWSVRMMRASAFDQVGDQGAQGVVVAELDFVGDHRVVFVDDRYDAQFEQGGEGRAGVEVALAVGQVVVGEEDLRRAGRAD